MNEPRDETIVDRDLTALYRRGSTAEPAAHLDDAIRAAARRAVHASPSQPRPARPSGMRGGWPMAAAATIAAITFGIVQLAPSQHDERAATTVASTEPAGPAAPAPPPGARTASTPPVSAPSDPARAERPPVASRPTHDARPRAAATPEPQPDVRRVAPSAPPPPQTAPAEASTPHAEASATILPNPFPASRGAPRVDSDPRRDAQEMSRESPVGTAGGDAPAATSESASASMAAPAAGAAKPLGRMAASAATEKSMTASGAAAVQPYDDWIKAIRHLVADRRYDEARREIVKLRAQYPERRNDLPAEFKAWSSPP